MFPLPELSACTTLSTEWNLDRILRREFMSALAVGSGGLNVSSALFDTVMHIVLGRAGPDMLGVHASGIVTGVARLQSAWEGLAVVQLPSVVRGRHFLAILEKATVSLSLLADFAKPRPALVRAAFIGQR